MIDILLSTYNGEKYVEELLESLYKQTYKDINLLIRDDGSTDKTLDVIKRYKDTHPLFSIHILTDDLGNIGSTRSFEVLMRHSQADYFMFCDQDDVWLPQKVEITLKRMNDLESSLKKNTPCVVFTDLYVVDEKLNIIYDSFFKTIHISCDVVNDLYKALAVSISPGCTMLMNRWILDYVLPIPKSVIHDFWVIVLTVKYGKVSCLNVPTIMYRQHGDNSIGSTLSGRKYICNKFKNLVNWFRVYHDFFVALPFKINYLKFAFWKLYYIFLRI